MGGGLTEARGRQRPSGDLAADTVPSVGNAGAVMSNETAGGIESFQQTRHGTLLGLSARALETDALFVSGLQRYEDPSAVRFGRPSPRRSVRSAAQVAPVGWRRRLAIIRRRR